MINMYLQKLYRVRQIIKIGLRVIYCNFAHGDFKVYLIQQCQALIVFLPKTITFLF